MQYRNCSNREGREREREREREPVCVCVVHLPVGHKPAGSFQCIFKKVTQQIFCEVLKYYYLSLEFKYRLGKLKLE